MAENYYDASYLDMMYLCNDLMRKLKIGELTISILIEALWNLDDSKLIDFFINELGFFHSQKEIEEYVDKNIRNLLRESKVEEFEIDYNRIISDEIHEDTGKYFIIQIEGDKDLKIKLSKDFSNVQEKMFELVDTGLLKIPFTPFSMVIALFENEDKTFKEFFERMDIKYENAKAFFMEYIRINNLVIPQNISDFVMNYQDIIKLDITKPNPILMRDKEAEKLWNILAKKTKSNAIIVGREGVGKSALVEKITYDIITRKCPKKFFDYNVLFLDVNALIAGTNLRGQAEEKILNLVNYIENTENVILFIDEVHTILNAGSVRDGDMTLSTALKPCLARGNVSIIGATTTDEYERYFSNDLALRRRFEKIEISEPFTCEVGDMIKNKVKSLSEFHDVTISKELVEFCIFIAGCFYFEKNNPDKTLDLIDTSMSIASLKDKKAVDKSDILESVDAYIDMYKNMTEAQKKEVAYHETGHLTVGLFSRIKENSDFLAISIMPADNYYGVVVTEGKKNTYHSSSYEYYIDRIAFCLAGRVGEKIFTKEISSSAASDLNKATQIAYNMVTEFGLIKNGSNELLNQNRVYGNCSEKSEEAIEIEVNRIISESYKRAEEIIKLHYDFFDTITKKLLEKGILTKKEIDEVYYSSLKKNQKV